MDELRNYHVRVVMLYKTTHHTILASNKEAAIMGVGARLDDDIKDHAKIEIDNQRTFGDTGVLETGRRWVDKFGKIRGF